MGIKWINKTINREGSPHGKLNAALVEIRTANI